MRLHHLTPTPSKSPHSHTLGQVYIQCFVAVDKHAAAGDSAVKKTCRSLPMCVKIVMEGSKPDFVAPTPLMANSLDDYGRLVPRRTDVPACIGFPLNLPLRAEDPDGDDVSRQHGRHHHCHRGLSVDCRSQQET